MGILSVGDKALVDAMRRGQNKVLRDMDWTKFDFTRLIMVTCADGSELPGVMEHQRRLVENQRPGVSLDDCCIHTLALNGGGLNLAEKSPIISNLGEDRVLLKQIFDAIRIKKLDANGERPRILIRTHSSCGAAAPHNLDVVEQMDWLAAGKDRLKMAIPKARVLCVLDIRYPAEGHLPVRQRSYPYSTTHLRDWMQASYSGGLLFETRFNYGLAAARA